MPSARTEQEHERIGLLVRTIERSIIPRLMLAHRDNAELLSIPSAAPSVPGLEDIASLCGLLLRDDVDAVVAFVRQVRERGAPAETVLMSLLAPTARQLGRMWEEDRCDFTAVTLGLWRLQRILYDVAHEFRLDGEPPADGRRALLTAVPGEQHTFGLFIVAEFFRRDGWDVIDAPFPSVDDLAVAVRRDWYAVVGLSIGAERWIDRLAASVRRVRQASLNTGVGIIVGGPLFHDQPDLAARVGADAFALDAPGAVACARSLLRTGAPLC